MAAKGKVQRLRKVAGEFNLGTVTIIEFLEKNNFEVDNNPNAKITPEMYELLEKTFNSDKSVKEEKEKLAEEYRGRRDKRKEQEVEEKTIISTPVPEPVAPPKPEKIEIEVPKPKVVDKIDLDKVASKSKPKPKPKKVEEAPKEEVVEAPKLEKKTEVKPEEKPIKEELVKEKPKVEKAIEKVEKPIIEKKEETNKADTKKGPKVLGNIDLDSMNQKTRPAKKSRKQRQKEEAEKQNAAAKKSGDSKNKVFNKVSKPQGETKGLEPKKETKRDVENKDSQFIKTNIQQLSGPVVVGKIVLPEKKKPQKKKVPVGSSSTDPKKKTSDNNKKRRRKRIKTAPPVDAKAASKKGSFDNRKKRAKKKREVKPELSAEDISKQIKETLARLSDNTKSKGAKYRRKKRDAVSQTHQKEIEAEMASKSVIKATEFVSASELGTMMDVSVNEIIKACMSLGMFVSINQRLDAETINIVAEEFGYTVEFVGAKEVEESFIEIEDTEEDLLNRNPIVTVMGHVDHGKTSLLDYIRETNVIAGEAGGITQHIGAYEVELKTGEKITFLDTPGHEAFTAMRARGSKITDIAIIVIAADDSIMPQTKEAITHAQAAEVPMVFAINKVDRDNANPDKIKEELANMNLLVEDWGGKYQSQDISAKFGTGVDQLMEKIVLEAELLELKANPNREAKGTVLEASLDKGKGYVTKVLVQNGTLKIGDAVLAGTTHGKVKAMYNERNKAVKTAGPATPVLLLGLNSAPQAGDAFRVMPDEKEARSIAIKREQLQREQGVRTQKHITLDEIGRRLAVGDFKELNLIIKGDVDGSVEALSDSLIKLSTDEISVNIIQKSVGQVNEADVMLASASDAIIIAFQVRPSLIARQLADKEEIDIRTFSIIYDVVDEIKAAMTGMLSPDIVEEVLCSVEVREVFKISKVGTIAGCYVLDGKIHRNTRVRIIRNGIVIYTGGLGSLKRFKDDVKEVNKGFECGLNIENFNDIKVGDIIEGFGTKEVKRTL
ncbi:MAG: translation initiation factor IF-2 [Bacteroidetes bacterium]|nr:MAG: translation initiation factor IF-2 [Bacteroidota bacterium]